MTITSKKRNEFHKHLHAWYAEHGRHHLPWRQTDDPYHILVSEMMLQQTQVSTVLDRFYGPFLARFPNLTTLASASLEDVLQQWQGLGYYRRARYLHQTAQLATPKLPSTYDQLIKLPGIGRNTAHALLALAYKQPYAVMEANVKRIICRIYGLTQPTDTQLWQCAAELLDTSSPFDYNQAMMDIGSQVCTPKTPSCAACPAQRICLGKHQPEAFPTKKAKKQVPIRKQHIIVAMNDAGQLYSRPRDGEFLHGLHQFLETDSAAVSIELLGRHYPQETWQHIGDVSQTYSHFKQEAQVHLLRCQSKENRAGWHLPEDFDALPMSQKERKVLALIAAL